MKTIDDVNNQFYNHSGATFDKIPFGEIMTELLLKYVPRQSVLEVGSGTGALALWLMGQGCELTCLEPAQAFAKQIAEKGLTVYPTTLQNYESKTKFAAIIAISSLIHIPKADLPLQIQKIAGLLNSHGVFIVSMIEGEGEAFEDPTNVGKLRYFAKWTEDEFESLVSPFFTLCEKHTIFNERMDRTFLLRVYQAP